MIFYLFAHFECYVRCVCVCAVLVFVSHSLCCALLRKTCAIHKIVYASAVFGLRRNHIVHSQTYIEWNWAKQWVRASKIELWMLVVEEVRTTCTHTLDIHHSYISYCWLVGDRVRLCYSVNQWSRVQSSNRSCGSPEQFRLRPASIQMCAQKYNNTIHRRARKQQQPQLKRERESAQFNSKTVKTNEQPNQSGSSKQRECAHRNLCPPPWNFYPFLVPSVRRFWLKCARVCESNIKWSELTIFLDARFPFCAFVRVFYCVLWVQFRGRWIVSCVCRVWTKFATVPQLVTGTSRDFVRASFQRFTVLFQYLRDFFSFFIANRSVVLLCWCVSECVWSAVCYLLLHCTLCDNTNLDFLSFYVQNRVVCICCSFGGGQP